VAKDIKAMKVFGELKLDEGSLYINKHQMDIEEKGMSKEKVTRKLTIDGYF